MSVCTPLDAGAVRTERTIGIVNLAKGEMFFGSGTECAMITNGRYGEWRGVERKA